MLVRRGGRDAGAAAGVSQREAVGTVLDQKLARGGNQRFAKISMVEPLLRAHGCSFFCLGHDIFFLSGHRLRFNKLAYLT